MKKTKLVKRKYVVRSYKYDIFETVAKRCQDDCKLPRLAESYAQEVSVFCEAIRRNTFTPKELSHAISRLKETRQIAEGIKEKKRRTLTLKSLDALIEDLSSREKRR